MILKYLVPNCLEEQYLFKSLTEKNKEMGNVHQNTLKFTKKDNFTNFFKNWYFFPIQSKFKLNNFYE